MPSKMDNEKLGIWKEALGKMTFLQLLRTECKVGVQWKKMFVPTDDIKVESLKCVLCETAIISSIGCIRQHILGRKHMRKMELSATAIRHPNINPFRASTGGAGPRHPANENNKQQAKVPLKSAQDNNKQQATAAKPANQVTLKLNIALKLPNPSNQSSDTTAQPENQNNPKPANPGTVPKHENEINPKSVTASKPANAENQRDLTASNPVSQINPKPEIKITPKLGKIGNQNVSTVSTSTNEKNQAGIALKPANSSNQNCDRKVVIKCARMSEEMQQDAVNCATQALEKYTEKDIVKIPIYIQKEFNKKYNPRWHCIVGSYFGSCVEHDTRHYICFCLGQVAIVLFKSG